MVVAYGNYIYHMELPIGSTIFVGRYYQTVLPFLQLNKRKMYAEYITSYIQNDRVFFNVKQRYMLFVCYLYDD